jgi:hypothetical protein
MRALLALPLALWPAFADAEPSLKCNFEGNKYAVVIVNPDAANKQCNYACHYTLEGGSRSVSGSTGVKAGETKTADEDTTRSKLTGVRSSSLDCK